MKTLEGTTELNMYAYENGVTEKIVVEVHTDWLASKVTEHMQMELQDFLDSYTCDTIDWLHELAVKEQQIVTIENAVVELDGYKFRESYLYDAVDHFNTSIDELKEINGREDLKTYPSYQKFYKSYYANTYDTMEQLIDLMYSQDIEPPDKDYFILAGGEVIHIYS